MSTEAHNAWLAYAKEHRTISRSDYVNGYDEGARVAQERVIAFVADNIETLYEFSDDNAMRLMAYILREMKPDLAAATPTENP